MYTCGALNDSVSCKNIVDNCRNMFESRISAGRTQKFSYSENLRISTWFNDMEGHAKKCVERYCELANKTTQQLYRVSTPCIDDHHIKEEELKPVGDVSKVCSQIVLKCWNLASVGRLDIPWSVNKLVRSITKWTKACDNDYVVWSHTSITNVNSDNIVMWETQHNIADKEESSKIGVLKQSQPVLFCSITHMKVLFVFTCVFDRIN